MASLMDDISETMNNIHEGMLKPYIIKVDEENSESIGEKIYDALEAIPRFTKDLMIKVYGTFLVETKREKGL